MNFYFFALLLKMVNYEFQLIVKMNRTFRMRNTKKEMIERYKTMRIGFKRKIT